MLALTIGLFLLGGVIQLFASNKQTYRANSALGRIQENGRFALGLFSRSVRVAGFSGCSSANQIDNTLAGAPNWWQDFGTNFLLGFDGTQDLPVAASSSGAFANDRVPGTDAIVALGGGEVFFIVAHTPPASSFVLSTLNRSDGSALAIGDVLTVCNVGLTASTSLFAIDAIPAAATVQYVTPLLQTYGPESVMTEYTPTAFYIGTSVSGTGRSLYQFQLAGGVMAAQEMVEGVEDMQLFYGVDTNADSVIDQYADATTVANWANVLSVRVYLLISSHDEDNLLNQPQTYVFPPDIGASATVGQTVQATDRRIYQVFSTTVGIRNRLP
jgi:type IV pilus assembly protein PilW